MRLLERGRRTLLAAALACGSLSGWACAAHKPPRTSPSPPPSVSASSLWPTVETTDVRLRQALAATARGPDAGSLAAVAAEYSRLGVFDRAVSFLTRAIALAPRDHSLYSSRARAWRDWGRPDLALGDGHRAVALRPDSADALNTLGTIQFALDQTEEAAASFRRSLALAPGASWALNNLCYVAFVTGREAEALDRCREALAKDATLATARNNLAIVHASAGRLDEARAVLLAAGNPAVAFYNFGIMMLARGEIRRAADAFAAACLADPAAETACRRASESRAAASRGGSKFLP